MRVAFCPFAVTNPYQARLAMELQSLGAVVEGMPASALLLVRSSTAWRSQVLHIHWTDPLLLAPGWIKTVVKSIAFLSQLALCRLLGKRIVWTAHNLADHEKRFPRTQRFFTILLAKLAHRVIVHSHAAASIVSQALRVPAAKIRVVPHAHYVDDYPNLIDPSTARMSLGIPNHAMVFLFFGQIRAYKGVRELIEAFRQLDEVEVRLLIVGKPYDDRVDHQVRGWIAGDNRIDYRPGFIAGEQVPNFFSVADVAILPYSDVLTSGSLLLVMSLAKACIIPNVPTLTEVMPSDGAFVYDPKDSNALTSALQEACNRRGQLPTMGQRNLQAVQSWGWPEMARATYTAYRD